MGNKIGKEPFKHQVYRLIVIHILWTTREGLGFFQRFFPFFFSPAARGKTTSGPLTEDLGEPAPFPGPCAQPPLSSSASRLSCS